MSLPFVDANDALNSFRPGQQSTRFPDAPLGLVYPGDPGVPRGTYETDKNNFAPRVGLAWDPTGTGRSSLRAAWGIFYDALAGQGDFFQNGVLAPPFTPLLEVNSPPAAITLRNPLTAVSGGANNFPPGLTFIGWGEDFQQPSAHHFNVTWQQEIGRRLGAEVGYVGSRGKNLPIFMEVNPGRLHAGQTTPGARLFPAFALVRPTFSVAQVVVRLAAGQPAHAPDAAASASSRPTRSATPRITSRASTSAARLRPVLPVTIGDEASIERALDVREGRRAVRRAPPLRRQLRRRAAGPDGRLGACTHVLGGWQLNGIVQAQTGFPLTVTDPATEHPLPDQPAESDLRSERRRAADRRAVVQHLVLPAPALADTAEPGSTPRNSVRGPGFARTDLSLFKNIALRAQPPHPAARRSVQPVQPDALRTAWRPDRRRRTSAASRRPRTAGSSSWR